MAVSRSELLKLARTGAERRLNELQSEIASLLRLFPDLRRSRRGRPAGAAAGNGRARGRRGWTAAQRKAAADRMRKYWAARRGKK
jgi:hypothetical protein